MHDPKLLKNLYRDLLLIRLTDEEIAKRYSEQEMRCPVHLSIGQEGVAAGVCRNLKKTDLVYSTHRCHAHYLAKGGDIKKMIAEIYGRATGCCGGVGGSMHLIDLQNGFGGATPIVGNSMPVAVGSAFASKLKGDKKVTVVFVGDGTMEEGVAHESLNFAALHNLPILFVCENNLYSVYTHLSKRQLPRPIAELAKAHGIQSHSLDGSDTLAVYDHAKKAVDNIRAGGGPVFLEFATYRYREHCGPGFDDQLEYRDPKEVEIWKKKDPIPLFEKKTDISEKDIAKIRKEVDAEIQDAFVFAKKSPFPAKNKLFENLYA